MQMKVSTEWLAMDRGYSKSYTVVNKCMDIITVTNDYEKAVRFKDHVNGSILQEQEYEDADTSPRAVLRHFRGNVDRRGRARTLEGAT